MTQDKDHDKDREDAVRNHDLKRALDDVAMLRRKVRGRDFIPGATAMRLWPAFVLLYTILDLVLKMLARRDCDGYGPEQQRKEDGHYLGRVFHRLSEESKEAMRSNYLQLVSLLNCGGDMSGFRVDAYGVLDDYLQELDNADGQYGRVDQGRLFGGTRLLTGTVGFMTWNPESIGTSQDA